MKKVLVVWALFALAGCGAVQQKPISIDDYEKTYKVSSWSIYSNNKYVWTLQSDDSSFLSFKMPWRITAIYVKEGDSVKAWQLLAVLGGNEVKTQFASAKDMLASLWNMYKSTENMFNAQIKSMEAKVAQAKAGMEGMKTGLGDTQKITKEQLLTAEKQVKQAEIGLQTAKTNLEHTKQVLKQKEQDLYSNSKNAIAQSRILLWNFVLFIDQLFGISDENRTKNDAFERYLSAKNSSLKEQIKTDRRKLYNKYKNWRQETDTLLTDIQNSKSVADDEALKQRIYENLQKTKELLILSRKLSDKAFTAVDNSVSAPSFPQTMINQYKQQITTFQKNIEWALLTAQWNFLLWVKWSIQNIENFKKQSSMQLDLLQKQYDLAKAGYETAKQTYEQYKAMSAWKVNEVSTKYTVAQKQYEEALKWLEALKKQKQAQLSQIKSKIDQVKWNRNLAAVSLWNIRLYAPYAGVITAKMANIWQVVGAGMPVLQIANPNKLKWVFYVPVEEIQNIKIWQKVKISALWQTVTGAISRIYPATDMMSKKIPVEVKLNSVPKTWKLGMFITGYPMNETFYWLVIPHEFIHYEYGKAYVYKKQKAKSKKQKLVADEKKIDMKKKKEKIEEWKKYEKVYIKLGKCDDNFCIVEKGVEVGDIIK